MPLSYKILQKISYFTCILNDKSSHVREKYLIFNIKRLNFKGKFFLGTSNQMSDGERKKNSKKNKLN